MALSRNRPHRPSKKVDMSHTFRSFEDLIEFLRNWRSWGGSPEYDFVGITQLLGACLSSIQENALDAEIEDLPDLRAPSHLKLLVRLGTPSTPTVEE